MRNYFKYTVLFACSAAFLLAFGQTEKKEFEVKGKKLTEEQYYVCQMGGTERPFTGKYWNHKGDGVYACVVCDQELFDSKTKYESGSGWPSFYDAIESGKVATKRDTSHGMIRTEILCAKCGSHLGHVFDDGPRPTGLRYCVNSASLDFVSRDDAKAEEKDK